MKSPRFVIAIAKRILRIDRLTRAVDFVVRNGVARTFETNHNGIHIVFTHANLQIRSRNETFATKEPMTLEWIDGFEEGAVFWDIGANVGLYSIYAALRKSSVYSFEPSVFNLEFLARNIYLNALTDRVTIVPLAVGGSGFPVSTLNLSSVSWGDSQSSFGTTLGQEGEEMTIFFDYRILGVSLDAAASQLKLPIPRYLKIDVDGIEPEILASGPIVLQSVEQVLVESPVYSGAEDRINGVLMNAGLRLSRTEGRNQLWVRTKL